MKNDPSIASSSSEVSEGQFEVCVRLVVDATRKATGVVLRELIESGVLTKQNIERVRARGDQVVAKITQTVKETFAEIAENIVGLVKLISGAATLELDATDGQETLANAQDTFAGWIDPNFKGYGCDVESGPTKKIPVSVYEMTSDGTFDQIFHGLSVDLDCLCLTQPQIINFVKKWLRPENCQTFFLFKVKDEFFVASVYWHYARELRLIVHRFSSNYVWLARDRCRLVVPQLASVTPAT